MSIVKIWECPRGHRTVLLPDDLLRMSQHRKGSPTADPFVDFVCPDCGFGTRRLARDLPEIIVQAPIRYRASLFHADLKCVAEGCSTHATVHTLAESGKPTAGPKKAVPTWKLDGIRCYEEHPVTVPIEVKSSRVTGGEES